MRNPMATMTGALFRLALLVVVATVSCNSNFVAADPGYDSVPLPPLPPGGYRYYHFNVEQVNHSVNCNTKPIITVNGLFPGPTIYVNEGDRVIVNVTNSSPANMTIHFHGVKQHLSNWMDGVAYITMCPLQPGSNFVHDFIITEQRGTLLWHAHIAWQRATVHGAFVMYPAAPYPFKQPYKEFPVVLQEWWYKELEQVESDGLADGGPFPVSDAMTINGHPGPTYNCSATEGVTTLDVRRGKTYLLRLVNAALNSHLYFAIANHTLTVVEADAAYTYPVQTELVFLSPGQTLNVLVTANQDGGTYYMSVQGYGRDNIPVVRPAALFKYNKPSPLSDFAFAPILPAYNTSGTVTAFLNGLRTLYPGRVPLTVNRNIFLAVGLTDRPCQASPVATNCTGLRIQGAINNNTFDVPTTALTQANYFNIPGVFTEDFPDAPLYPYDYTGPTSPPPALRISQYATKIIPITYNDTVQITFQDTMVLGFEDHPFHLHGHNFYVLGQGFGNFDPTRDNNDLNLYDPPLRNTVSIPYQGWAVIRIKANNPGMWFLHCHLDKHTSWGMETVFHVHDGIGPNNTLPPPPSYLPPC